MLNPNKCLFLRLTSLRCHCVLFTCACRLFPHLSTAIHPFLPPLSVLVTACCVEAPPAINVDPVMSPFGITSFLHFIYQHLLLVIFLLVLSSPRHLTSKHCRERCPVRHLPPSFSPISFFMDYTPLVDNIFLCRNAELAVF